MALNAPAISIAPCLAASHPHTIPNPVGQTPSGLTCSCHACRAQHIVAVLRLQAEAQAIAVRPALAQCGAP